MTELNESTVLGDKARTYAPPNCPHRALATFEPRGSDSKAWLLLNGEYVEVTHLCNRIELVADVGDVTCLVLRIPVAASGKPPTPGEEEADV